MLYRSSCSEPEMKKFKIQIAQRKFIHIIPVGKGLTAPTKDRCSQKTHRDTKLQPEHLFDLKVTGKVTRKSDISTPSELCNSL